MINILRGHLELWNGSHWNGLAKKTSLLNFYFEALYGSEWILHTILKIELSVTYFTIIEEEGKIQA